MSTHTDPNNDKYLKLEKKLGAAEQELAAEVAEADKALDDAAEKGKKKGRAARARLKRKIAPPSREHDSDGLQNYTLEATAARSDLNDLTELVRAQSLLHR